MKPKKRESQLAKRRAQYAIDKNNGAIPSKQRAGFREPGSRKMY